MDCFVIGPIGDQLGDPGSDGRETYEQSLKVFEEVIVAACEPMGIHPYRANDIDDTGEIPDQIFEALRDERLVIADLTGANPNVMYELGVRHVLNKCTIQIGEKDRLPFDISTIRTIQFKHTPGGLISARNKLAKVVGNAMANGCKPTSAARVISLDTTVSATGGESTEGDPIDPVVIAETAAGDDLEEPMGMLEAQVEIEEAPSDITERTTEMTQLLSEYTEITRRFTPRIRDATKPAHRLGLAASYAKEIEPVVRKFDEASVQLAGRVSSLDLAIRFFADYLREKPEEIEDAEPLIRSLVTLAETSRDSIDNGMTPMRDSLRVAENVSRELRPVIQIMIRAVDRTISDFHTVESWGQLMGDLAPTSPDNHKHT